MVRKFPIRNIDWPGYIKPKICELLIEECGDRFYLSLEFKDKKGNLGRTWLESFYTQIVQAIEQFNLEKEYMISGPTEN